MHFHFEGRGAGPRGWGGPRGGIDDHWGDRQGGERRGGGRRRVFDGGELRLVLLHLIAAAPRHGYELIRAIEELSGGAYAPSPGMVYPALAMLDEMALIEEQASEGARKRFAATATGEAHLAGQAEIVATLVARLRELGDGHRRGDHAPIRRAIANLRHAVHERVSRPDADEDRIHAVAAILDEAARTIERLR